MNKITYKIIYIVLFILIICSAFYILYFLYSSHNTQKENKLLNDITILQSSISNEDNNDNKNTIQKTERMKKLETLQKQNPDIIGWIEIEHTNINYPVVQGKDNNYYLNHNYKKKYSANGSIFLDYKYSWNPPSSNLLIYGHHSTFKDLLKYQNKKFYNEHPTIRFTTNEEDINYEIIAVFKSKVYYQSEKNVFRYYHFIDAKNKKEYDEFVSDAKNASLYNTGKTSIYGDKLLTISTCSYHTKDGRFVVIAKKVNKKM